MTAEYVISNNPHLEKTVKIDRRIREIAVCTGALSVAGVCFAPFVLIPTALVSGIVFHLADRQLKINQKELKNDTGPLQVGKII